MRARFWRSAAIVAATPFTLLMAGMPGASAVPRRRSPDDHARRPKHIAGDRDHQPSAMRSETSSSKECRTGSVRYARC